MSLFSDDRAAELRELFFESAQELLQSLNDAGLALEKRPGERELIRRVRRTIHTLKGDAAACGFRELSQLAHELEDALAPDLAPAAQTALAEVVLSTADTFDAMLAAYRSNLQPPAGDALRKQIRRLLEGAAPAPAPAHGEARFAWSEYEQVMIAEAAARGESVYNVALYVDPNCPMRAAALQLVRTVLQHCGSILVLHPDDNTPAEDVTLIEAALASHQPQEWIAKKCQVPAVVRGIVMEKAAASEESDHNLLEILAEPAALSSLASQKGVPAQLADAHQPAPAIAIAPGASGPRARAESVLRVDATRIDAALNLVGELIIGKSILHRAMEEFDRRFPRDPLRATFSDALAFQARVLNELHKSVLQIRMVPVEQLFRRFPRVVRDVAKQRGRDVALSISGQNTDLDKTILDALAEPLTHLVRNAVDHGLEPPEERVAAGKPARGTMRLNAYHQANQVVIEVGDDGRGIDREKLVTRAIEAGVLARDEARRLTEAEQLHLIFHPGLSTAEEVTEISGRGVGMDVVRNALDQLKGSVTIDTRPGGGTTFVLTVPLTLASIKALLFSINGQLYAVPLAAVREIARATEAEIHHVEEQEVIQLRDHVLTLVRMSRPASRRAGEKERRFFILVIGLADRKFGLIVDRVVGEEELVIKAMDDKMVASELVSGASILGDGTVVLILNLSAILPRPQKVQPLGVMA